MSLCAQEEDVKICDEVYEVVNGQRSKLLDTVQRVAKSADHKLSRIITRDELIWLINQLVEDGTVSDTVPLQNEAGQRSGTRAHSKVTGRKRRRSG